MSGLTWRGGGQHLPSPATPTPECFPTPGSLQSKCPSTVLQLEERMPSGKDGISVAEKKDFFSYTSTLKLDPEHP